MELSLTIAYAVMIILAAVNWIIAMVQPDTLKKIASILEAIFFILMAIILQIVG
jgi:hypothetical protein